ncbi:hypothetical protein [Streptomyces sp. NPDC048196]|uniref:hypothetical protein n=1 Tax=Streptomyces sp. NPDC048196 TaxID=3154712 RepID=UPI0033EC5943
MSDFFGPRYDAAEAMGVLPRLQDRLFGRGSRLRRPQRAHRSQPVLPTVPGVPERRSHDYVRAGTTTLFFWRNGADLQVGIAKLYVDVQARPEPVLVRSELVRC